MIITGSASSSNNAVLNSSVVQQLTGFSVSCSVDHMLPQLSQCSRIAYCWQSVMLIERDVAVKRKKGSNVLFRCYKLAANLMS